MNSKDYWAEREAEQLKHNITEEKEYDKQIKRIYTDMLDSVQKEINGFYGRYADKEGITLAEAKKRVSQLDIAEYERKAKRYVRDKDFSAQANEEMRLYNATMKINRLEMLKANIGLELISGHQELESFMGDILKGRTEEELKRQAGILGKTIKSNAQKANAIVNGSFHNAKFSDRIWQYQDIMKNDLAKMLQTGLIQGKNPRAIAKDLKKYWFGADPRTGGGITYCIERLMRTELARVQTEAQKQSFVRNGFEEYTFIGNGDCCPICAGLNGKHFKVSKMMPGENAPPMHPHCRCSTAAYEDSKEYENWLDFLDKGGTTAEYNKLKAQGLAKNNKGLAAKISSDGIPKHKAPVLLQTIDPNNKQAVNEVLTNFEKSAITEKIETACVITKDGKVYKCFGINDRVFPDIDLGEELRGAIVTHNHPEAETAYTFSKDDLAVFMEYEIKVMRGCDYKYTYEFTRNASQIDAEPDDWMNFENFGHADMIRTAAAYGVGYKRWLNE